MTGLPANDTPWPPPQEAARYDRMRVPATWYAGDPDRLAALYINGYGGAEVAMDGILRKAVVSVKRFFWGSAPSLGERNNKVHIPVAQDIATMSSELLFAEGLTIRVDGPVADKDIMSEPVDGEEPKIETPKGEPLASTIKTQKRLDELLDKMNFRALVLAAAETQSPLGSVGLRVAWDKEVDPERPFLARADADSIITEYRWGKLIAVTFWRTISTRGETHVRHLERHERGRIYHGVYVGTLTNLGHIEPLADHGLQALTTGINEEGFIPVDEKYRFATSIPNMLPDPMDRLNAAGRSDYTPGVITLFDSIDEIATSLMRDIELAKGRLVVADYMLEDNGPGKGSTFNPETKIFSPLKMQPGEDGEAPITIVQFKIRVTEHLAAMEWFLNRAIRSAGFNPDSEQESTGGPMTATEVVGKNKRSLSTRDKKVMYWQPELEGILEALLAADKAEFTSDLEVFPIKVEFPDAVQPDIRMLAETVEFMRRAQAASDQTIVETLHPDWTPKEVADEVARMNEGSKIANPNTIGQSPQPPVIDPTLPPSREPQLPVPTPPTRRTQTAR